MSKYQLYSSFRALLSKDASPQRRRDFQFLLQNKCLVGIIYSGVERSGFLSLKLACALFYAFAKLRRLDAPHSGVASAHYNLENEKKHLLWFERKIAEYGGKGFKVYNVQSRFPLKTLGRALLEFKTYKNIKTVMSIASRLVNRYPLYVAMRSTELLTQYLLFRRETDKLKNRTFFVASEGSPVCNALLALDRAHGKNIRSVLALHSHVSPVPIRVNCTLGIFHGKNEYLDYANVHSSFDHLLYYPQDVWNPEKIQLNSEGVKSVCIGLSKSPNVEKLNQLIKKLSSLPDLVRIVVRVHPNTFAPSFINEIFMDEKVRLSLQTPLEKDIEETDLLIGGNSNILLNFLESNKPSIFVSELNFDSSAPMSFLKEGLILSKNVEDISLDVKEIHHFYSRSEWKKGILNYLSNDETEESFFKKLITFIESPSDSKISLDSL